MMPQVLTRLKITEVSAVDRGAGDGTKIVLMKRDDRPRSKPHLERYARRLRKFQEMFDSPERDRRRSFNEIVGKADDRDDSGGGGASDHHASKVADLLVEAGSHPDRASALSHLLHSPQGQALLARMHKKDDPPMTSTSTHAEFVRDVVKQFGVVALAKSMVQDQKSYGLDEHQFTQLATEHAQRVYSNDRPDSAFSKLYESEESVRRACQVAKAQTLDVMVVGGPDATHEAINNTEQSEAYRQLVDMAEKLRAESPFLSADQAFARVFENPANGKLSAKAHRRPAPTTSYPYPR
jgi:hypothetical protein